VLQKKQQVKDAVNNVLITGQGLLLSSILSSDFTHAKIKTGSKIYSLNFYISRKMFKSL